MDIEKALIDTERKLWANDSVVYKNSLQQTPI
jgi:hypothetical protein